MTNFGASFKRARESKGISIDQIAAETRISTRFLRAIENEDFQLLPGGIFNRGFIRAYAEKVGLDPNQAVADYEQLGEIRETSETPATAIASRASSNYRLYPLAIGGLVLLIIIFYVVTRESSNPAQTANPPPPTPPPAASPPAAPATTPSSPPAVPESTRLRPEPEPAAPAEALRIDMEIKETTWIRVDTDGRTVNPGEILQPGTTRHFSAKNSIGLIIGNAGGLVLRINDMPTKDLGKSGQVRQLNITPNNLKDFIG